MDEEEETGWVEVSAFWEYGSLALKPFLVFGNCFGVRFERVAFNDLDIF